MQKYNLLHYVSCDPIEKLEVPGGSCNTGKASKRGQK